MYNYLYFFGIEDKEVVTPNLDTFYSIVHLELA